MFVQITAFDYDGTVKWATIRDAFYIEPVIGTAEEYTGDLSAFQRMEVVLDTKLAELADYEEELADIEEAEAGRVEAENGRVSAENDRVLAEEGRVEAESQREATFGTLAKESEAWAVGTKDGTPVSQSDQQYHNNSKYYSDLAGPAAETATIEAAIAKSWASYSNDANIYGNNTDNAHYWSDQAASKYSDMIAAIGSAMNTINSLQALLSLLFGSIYLNTESGDVLNTESGDKIIIDY